ncbi:MAG: serine/threonine-protein kinase [Planctomycetota bacterium]
MSIVDVGASSGDDVPDTRPAPPPGPRKPGRPSGIIGHTLGGNTVIAKIGEGGMGAVFRAHDEGLDRDVAIKVLPPSLARDEIYRMRFLREARALARVKHPNLVQIYNVAAEKGLHFFSMEYIDGGSLSVHIVRAEQMPLGEILRIAGQVLSALAAVHACGVTHRDIKSANIMIEPSGRAVLMDLGLAKDEAATGVTTDGMILGTPEYMSPEQAEGVPATPQSDIYSFGIVLYEMATGELPFRGKSAIAVLRKQVEEEAPPLAELRPDLPPEFARAVTAAMRKKPEERPASAMELAGMLLEAGSTPELETLAASAPRGGAVIASHAITLSARKRSTAPTLLDDRPTGAATGAALAPRAPAHPPSRAGRSPWKWVALAAAVVILLGIAVGKKRRGRARPVEPQPVEAVEPVTRKRRRARVYIGGDELWPGRTVEVIGVLEDGRGLEVLRDDGAKMPLFFSTNPELRYLDEGDKAEQP